MINTVRCSIPLMPTNDLDSRWKHLFCETKARANCRLLQLRAQRRWVSPKSEDLSAFSKKATSRSTQINSAESHRSSSPKSWVANWEISIAGDECSRRDKARRNETNCALVSWKRGRSCNNSKRVMPARFFSDLSAVRSLFSLQIYFTSPPNPIC